VRSRTRQVVFLTLALCASAHAQDRTLSIAGREVAVWEPRSTALGAAPVLFFSHGFGGCATSSRFLKNALAVHGYWVFAPTHHDARCGARSDAPPVTPFSAPDEWTDATYADRADDIRAVQQALEISPDFARRVDFTRVGYVGHSLGGYTVIGLAGGWHKWTAPAARGVRAVLAMSPYIEPYVTHGTMAGITVPIMFQGGTADAGITPHVTRRGGAYEAAPRPKYLVVFTGASHAAWGDWRKESHEQIVAYSLAFLDRYVRDLPARPLLTTPLPGVASLKFDSELGRVTSRAEPDAASQAAKAARTLLEALPDSTRSVATFPFDTTERSTWYFVPIDRQGLTLARMPVAARPLVDSLLSSGLSDRGLATARGIIRHEAILGALEAANPPPGVRRQRDSTKYYLSVFGAPNADSVWGWRVEGHHLSVNYTGVGATGQVVAPLFMGANPAKVPRGPRAGFRLLADEEDVARELVLMFDPDRRARAIFSDTAFQEIETRNDPKARPLAMEGLRAADMTPPQQAQLRRLVEVYAGRMSSTARQHAMRDIDDAGFGELRFGWAGSTTVGAAHYYRIHGPTVLVEYDNQQNNANHIHTVWRDLRHDFGGDLLGAHYRKHAHARP
jgi:predicted dienelactone hydrolase